MKEFESAYNEMINEEIICESVGDVIDKFKVDVQNLLSKIKNNKNLKRSDIKAESDEILENNSIIKKFIETFKIKSKFTNMMKSSSKNKDESKESDTEKKTNSKDEEKNDESITDKSSPLYIALSTIDGFANMSDKDKDRIFAMINFYISGVENALKSEIESRNKKENKPGILSKTFSFARFMFLLPVKAWQYLKILVYWIIILLTTTLVVDVKFFEGAHTTKPAKAAVVNYVNQKVDDIKTQNNGLCR